MLKIWPVVCWLGRFLGGIRKNTGHFDNLNASDKVIYANLNNKVCASLLIMRDKVNLEEPANSVINSPQTRRCGLACPLCFYLYRLHWVKKSSCLCIREKREQKVNFFSLLKPCLMVCLLENFSNLNPLCYLILK